jgi:type II pantothenate kinase
VDDYDALRARWLGSKESKVPPKPHKRALLFVDNSGADVVLGMLPLARELLRRGTEVMACTKFSCQTVICSSQSLSNA